MIYFVISFENVLENFDYYLTKVAINGKEYLVRSVVQTIEGKVSYDHKLSEYKKYGAESSTDNKSAVRHSISHVLR